MSDTGIESGPGVSKKIEDSSGIFYRFISSHSLEIVKKKKGGKKEFRVFFIKLFNMCDADLVRANTLKFFLID